MTTRLNRREVLLRAGALAVLGGAQPVRAQPSARGTLRLVVSVAAGVGSDASARALAEAYRQSTGLPCIVENKPGANASIAAIDVARAKPDGQSILWVTGGHTTNAVLAKKLPYDSIRDFTPVTQLTRSPGFALIVGNKSPYRTLRELVEAARAQPGKLTYGSTGIGNTTHVAGALFCRSVGVEMLHVPYRTSPLVDTISGNVDMMFMSPTLLIGPLRTGQLRALGLSGDQGFDQLPDVPTYTRAGFQQPDLPAWSGVLAPPGMPPDVLAALHADLIQAARHPVFAKSVQDAGGTVFTTNPQAFRQYVVAEIDRLGKILPPLGIEMD
ncbi:Bug family tripartite tricarboxylate transporter substrate binding protein [Pseudorhodoferax sp.]|uniref:Bug family tripartite tricarboxylate transporter substrate binding protein n=1 Tax=Pseudorhodoferax sp. TaxID=1993553 RepID=UPI002DD681D8|nr:tripartite tricarboxylate transporter substrate binding protein [Pseudorhodoferax sp.]